MDIAKKNDSHIEKYNIEVLHKGTTSNIIYSLSTIFTVSIIFLHSHSPNLGNEIYY